MRGLIVRFAPFVILFSFFAFSTNVGAQGLSGPITSDTTWAAGDIVIQDSVTVLDGISLTIQPGAVVKFNSNGILVVAGTLIA
ncbi:MAG: hypothetical protein HY562_04235, partial [Ignavibacteriales bacterium]|nr:hypothetical protein [Ignavibacteriales bacterium]